MSTTDEVQYWVDELDDEACTEAQKDFTREFGAEVAETCDRLLMVVAIRYSLLRNGERPKAFGAFDRDEIERILAYDQNFNYDGYELDLGADFEKATDCSDCMIEVSKTTASEEAWTRFEFIKAFRKFLETAAAIAHKGSRKGSTGKPTREYRKILERVQENPIGYKGEFQKSKGQREMRIDVEVESRR